MVALETLTDLTWILLTSGIFLLLFSAPRLLAHILIFNAINKNWLISQTDKTADFKVTVLEDMLELMVAAIVIGSAYAYLFNQLEVDARALVGFIEYICVGLLILSLLAIQASLTRKRIIGLLALYLFIGIVILLSLI